MDKTIIGAIQEFIKGKRDEANIWNVIVRDDVFAILERECYVLYYALEGKRQILRLPLNLTPLL